MGRESFKWASQDARNLAVVEPAPGLGGYTVENMIDDLGDHRRADLPLDGQADPHYRPRRLGLSAAKTAVKEKDPIGVWSSVYDPKMDEGRYDGLGSGNAHRGGDNFQPNPSALAGSRNGRRRDGRARSLSPRYAGPGGLDEPAAGIYMGTRPPARPSASAYQLARSGSLSVRHIRPRAMPPTIGNTATPPRDATLNKKGAEGRADFINSIFGDPPLPVLNKKEGEGRANISNIFGNPLPVLNKKEGEGRAKISNIFGDPLPVVQPRPARPPSKVDVDDPDVSHWWTKRLTDFDNYIATQKLRNAGAAQANRGGLGASKHAVREGAGGSGALKSASQSNHRNSEAPTHTPKTVQPNDGGLGGSRYASENWEGTGGLGVSKHAAQSNHRGSEAPTHVPKTVQPNNGGLENSRYAPENREGASGLGVSKHAAQSNHRGSEAPTHALKTVQLGGLGNSRYASKNQEGAGGLEVLKHAAQSNNRGSEVPTHVPKTAQPGGLGDSGYASENREGTGGLGVSKHAAQSNRRGLEAPTHAPKTVQPGGLGESKYASENREGAGGLGVSKHAAQSNHRGSEVPTHAPKTAQPGGLGDSGYASENREGAGGLGVSKHAAQSNHRGSEAPIHAPKTAQPRGLGDSGYASENREGAGGLGVSKHAAQSNHRGSEAPTHAPKMVQPNDGGLRDSSHALENREAFPAFRNAVLATAPTEDGKWAMSPPSPTPRDGALPAESRRRATVSPELPSAHPSKAPLAPGGREKPPAPPDADSNLPSESKLAAIEDLQAQINKHEDLLNNASALLAGYSKQLGDLAKEENGLGERLKLLKSYKKETEERIRRQQAMVKEKTHILGDLRHSKDKLSIEANHPRKQALGKGQVLEETLEKDRLARLERKEHDKQRNIQAELRGAPIELQAKGTKGLRKGLGGTGEGGKQEQRLQQAKQGDPDQEPVGGFLSSQRNEARDNEAFQSANRALSDGPGFFPYKIAINLRPVFDHDPLELELVHRDQPGKKVRRALTQALGPQDAKYLMELDSWKGFLDDVTCRFYSKMAVILGSGI